MTENKKSNVQISSCNTAATSQKPAENRAEEKKKVCPALYPSKPNMSNK